MQVKQKKITTNLCDLYLVGSNAGLQGVYWSEQPINSLENTNTNAINEILDETERQLHEYLIGNRTTFNLKLDIIGSEFQKQVWAQLLKIPYGTTISYKKLAQNCGNMSASRAVGNANGKNPFCIIIPCHRVIASDGNLGGYSGGLEIKKNLLELEKKYYF
ncbi:methylated-DNA--[protein]-cysteine S-methyltransferase [Pigmentibacter sp. JX0631]|uniref:methylated-DNA--[protein]-cysteine S-methyltransferase n=1 Tax=Pigmentibacter sp. JX0631 TaxID=2976982 RepID=UPI002469C001|nr:methylated-DNA--[protein]-cysteine S-methyltransferase [Pigmentibacter sp. JX0631]WGL59730.1 methylated-DNA--[protein]-cysteine S-methyltransferase [Pigmentibacter sp. JX0631]